jgi:pimeloyl-ACP methyl ester carboxylesterase
MTGHRIVSVVSVLALATLLVIVAWDHRHVPPGFQQVDVGLAGGVPATLYFEDPPGPAAAIRPGIDQAAAGPEDRRGIILAHGYGGDRRTMESLAESLTHAGYTVVSIDEDGHGMNRNSYRAGSGAADHLVADIRAGVEYLRGTYGVAPSRIAVVGHSMGARAALAYGSHESGVAGLVMLSGSSDFMGPQRPANALFLYAAQDLPGIERSVGIVAAKLARVEQPGQEKTYGDFSAGTAVRVARIPGVGHGTILHSPAAFREIVAWLVTNRPVRTEPATFVDYPIGRPLLWLSFLLVLPGLGGLLARLAPALDRVQSRARWFDPALPGLALIFPLFVVAQGRSGVLMGLSDADANVTHLSLGGILLVVALVLSGRVSRLPDRLPGALTVAVVGWFAAGALLGPVSARFHGTGLTPEKAWICFWTAACLAPFAYSFQLLVHRDRWWHGTLLRLGGRLAVLIAVAAGTALGVFGFPGTIAVFVLLASLVIVEAILAGFYARSNNLVTAAGLDALITGWLFALYLPSNF